MILGPQRGLHRILESAPNQSVVEKSEMPGMPGTSHHFLDMVHNAALQGNERPNAMEVEHHADSRPLDEQEVNRFSNRLVDDGHGGEIHNENQNFESVHTREHTKADASMEQNDLLDSHDVPNRIEPLVKNDDTQHVLPRVKNKLRTDHKAKNINNADINTRGESGVNRIEEIHDVMKQAQMLRAMIAGSPNDSSSPRDLDRLLQSFHDQMKSADRSRRIELLQDLRGRLQEIIGHLESRQKNGPNKDIHLVVLREKIKSLGATIERELQGGNARQRENGQFLRQGKGHAERLPMQDTAQRADTRFETGKQTDAFFRIESASNISSRSGGSQMNVSVQRLPFGNEQFDLFMQQARIAVRDARNGSFVMNLYPETLGKVSVNLSLEEGVLVGRFLVDSYEAREAMRESIDRLLAQLADAGIEVGSFQVNVRGERDRLVQNLQNYLSENRSRMQQEGRGEYEVQSTRSHDGLIDVIA